MPRPELTTFPSFYHRYVQLVPEQELQAAFTANTAKATAFFEAIPDERWPYRYAEGKWSIKEMVQHITDTERIFAYRALCIARGEQQSLPGFDENAYAAASGADRRSRQDLLEEWQTVRKSAAQLFASFTEAQLSASGVANNSSITVLAIGFILPGHLQHHLNILAERYL